MPLQISYSAVKTCLSSALTLLCSEDNVPALIVCNLGKDRTGVLCSIVEALCEVSEEAIARDYSLSKVCWNYRHFLNKSVIVSICYTTITSNRRKTGVDGV